MHLQQTPLVGPCRGGNWSVSSREGGFDFRRVAVIKRLYYLHIASGECALFAGRAMLSSPTGDSMGDRSEGISTSGVKPSAAGRFTRLWPVLVCVIVAVVVIALIARQDAGSRVDSLLIAALLAATALLILSLLVRDSPVVPALPVADSLNDVLDSAGPAVVAIDLKGRLTYVNPAAERMLGRYAAELKNEWSATEILAPGEGVRLVAEMEKLSGLLRPAHTTAPTRMEAYLECVQSLPPSMVPSFDAQIAPQGRLPPARHPPHLRPPRRLRSPHRPGGRRAGPDRNPPSGAGARASRRSGIATCLKTPAR